MTDAESAEYYARPENRKIKGPAVKQVRAIGPGMPGMLGGSGMPFIGGMVTTSNSTVSPANYYNAADTVSSSR